MNQLSGAVSETRRGRQVNDLMVIPQVLVDPEVAWLPPPADGLRATPLTRAVRRSMRRGSRAHVSRVAALRKAPPSLGTVLGVRQPDGSIVRVSLIGREVAGADPLADAGKGRRG